MKNWKISGCLLAGLVGIIVIAACAWFAYKMRETTTGPPTEDPPAVNKPETSTESETGLNKYLPLGKSSNR